MAMTSFRLDDKKTARGRYGHGLFYVISAAVLTNFYIKVLIFIEKYNIIIS